MYKLLVVSALLSLYVAAPREIAMQTAEPALQAYAQASLLQAGVATVPLLKSAIVAEPTHVQVHEPTLAKLGDVLESVPTAVSHQSSTIVHSRAQRLTPIVAPAVRSYMAPAVRAFAAPIVQHAPLLRSAFLEQLGPAAAFVHAHAPLQWRSYAAGTPYSSLGYGVYGAPLWYVAPAWNK